MIRGIYTSASGMIGQAMLTDVVTNNIANINTSGFKKDLAVSKEFREMLIYRINDTKEGISSPGMNTAMVPIGYLGTGSMVDKIYTTHSQGIIRNTSNPLDLAIMGEGFFTVNTENGTRYTRNGAFSLNADQELITSNGDLVAGESGAIRLTGGKISVDESGAIYSDGVLVDRLRMVNFSDINMLEKQGESYFMAPNGEDGSPFRAQVQQGFLEGANVNAVSEMVNLINVYRTYEANQKIVQAQDETLGKAVNDVARV